MMRLASWMIGADSSFSRSLAATSDKASPVYASLTTSATRLMSMPPSGWVSVRKYFLVSDSINEAGATWTSSMVSSVAR